MLLCSLNPGRKFTTTPTNASVHNKPAASRYFGIYMQQLVKYKGKECFYNVGNFSSVDNTVHPFHFIHYVYGHTRTPTTNRHGHGVLITCCSKGAKRRSQNQIWVWALIWFSKPGKISGDCHARSSSDELNVCLSKYLYSFERILA